MSRSFTIQHIFDSTGKIDSEGSVGGRYISSAPGLAVRKAAQKICQYNEIKGPCTFTLYLRETTQGSGGKIYKYKAKRVKSTKSVMRGGIEIKYKFRFVIKSLRYCPDLDAVMSPNRRSR